MIRIVFAVLMSTFFLSACTNDEKSSAKKTAEEITIDTLNKQVDDGHIVGMSKMGKLNRLQQRTKAIIDSIAKLTPAAQSKLREYKNSLDSTLKQLDYADFAMNKWMSEYNMDSAKDDVKKRISYLSNEKIKVDNMTQAILSSIRKADSLFESRN